MFQRYLINKYGKIELYSNLKCIKKFKVKKNVNEKFS